MRPTPKRISPPRTILFWLNCLVLASLVPAAIVTTANIFHTIARERTALQRDLIGTARALSQAVDAELAGSRSALFVLADSPYLASGDLANFYQDAQRALSADIGDNIVLTDLDGQQLINTREPFGASLPRRGNIEQQHRTIESKQVVISDLFIGAATQKPLISIEMPIFVGGEPRYVLAIGLLPARLNRILHQQKMPADWAAAIVDNSDTIVARTLGDGAAVGKKVTPELRRALSEAPEGAFEGVSREGINVLSSFSRSEVSGWTVAIAVPKAALFNFFEQAIYGNLLAAYVFLIGGVVLAGRISTRIAKSIQALRDPALEVGSRGQLEIPNTKIKEVNELGQCLIDAHELIEQRTTERNNLRRRIMKAQEEERLRLAHDLHDETGQSLSAAILDLKALEPFVERKGLERFRDLRLQLDRISRMLHRIAWELRPASIDELGLTTALETYLADWGAQHSIKTDFHNADIRLDERPDEIGTTLYRIIQEALTNVAKHANGATHVSVGIGTLEGTLRLTIEDNGQGFDPSISSPRLGLAGMRERLLLVGGRLEIESSPGHGASLYVRIPLTLQRVAA